MKPQLVRVKKNMITKFLRINRRKHTKHSKKKHHTDENPVDTSNTSRHNETKTRRTL